MSSLMLHSGAESITREALMAVATPDATESWQPIPHVDVLDLVTAQVEAAGMSIVRTHLGLARMGQRFFGTLDVEGGTSAPDYRMAIGLRNSHDKSFPAGLACGERVFVCDNLAFHASIVLARKHTSRILGDLPRLVADALGHLSVVQEERNIFIAKAKVLEIGNRMAHDFIVRAVDAKVIPTTKIPAVLDEWRNPSFDDFAPRTLWSLYNGFTFALKGYNDAEIARRTQRLTGLSSMALKGRLDDVLVTDFEMEDGETE